MWTGTQYEQPTTPCVVSREGHGDGHGYRVISRGGVKRRAQVWAWLDAGREIPDGHTLDHLCRNRSCVALEHLETVPAGENTARQRRHWAATREVCSKGHAWSPENTYVAPDGVRYCRECGRARKRAYKARQRDLVRGQ